MNLANILTVCRLFTSPVFYLIYSKYLALGLGFSVAVYLMIILLALSEFSDFLDGYIARKWKQVTDFGKIFDPMADSITHTCIYLTFTLPPISLPIGYIFIFLYRDLMISTLRTICALKGFTLAARKSGKIKAVLLAGVAFVILGLLALYSWDVISLETLQITSFWCALVAVFYSLLSGVEYIIANRAHIKSVLFSRS